MRQVVTDLAMLNVGGGGDGGQRTVCGQRLQPAESPATRAWRTHPASAMSASTQSRTTSATRNHPPPRGATASTGCRSLTRTHPRLRGERWETAARWRMLMDAPLLARGARFGVAERNVLDGLTPAYAGSASGGGGTPTGSQTHPRLRGERTMGSRVSVAVPDSPPPTRGARLEIRRVPLLQGLTPACAGSASPG